MDREKKKNLLLVRLVMLVVKFGGTVHVEFLDSLGAEGGGELFGIHTCTCTLY